MLKSLRIQNFRVFEDLVIDRLAPVNLIVGRNNIGKTTLLEALHLYHSPTIFDSAHDLLKQRKEFAPQDLNLLVSWQNLFYQGQDQHGGVHIGEYSEESCDAVSRNSSLSIYPRWMWREDWVENGEQHTSRQQFGETPPPDLEAIRVLTAEQSGEIINYTDVASLSSKAPPLRMRKLIQQRRSSPPCFLLPFGHKDLGKVDTTKLWDQAVLHDQEEQILEILHLIEPNLEKVRVIQAQCSNERLIMVKISGQKPVPLHSLGDGITRLFELAVNLVNLDVGGTLLVDEMDVGLHYSTLADLWRVILKIARKLTVQIFATTHSWDCIQAFQEAVAEDPETGLLIRLEQGEAGIRSEIFAGEELQIITNNAIEVR